MSTNEISMTQKEAKRANRIEKQVLRKLRNAYEVLQNVQEILDQNEGLLTKTHSFLTEEWLSQGEGDSVVFKEECVFSLLDGAMTVRPAI
jgi:hypothetical protein